MNKKLYRMIIDNSKVELHTEINENTNLIEDLGYDSIELMILLVQLEEALGINFDDMDLDYNNLVICGELNKLVEHYFS